MKILIMSDNPSIDTGMGRVHRELGRGLKASGHQVASLGWFSASWLKDWSEWTVHKTYNNYYGQDVFDEVIIQERPDFVITIGDCWMVSFLSDPYRCRTRFMFQWLMYTPVDGEAFGGGIPTTWIPVLKSADKVIAYTKYGKEAILKSIPLLKDTIEMIYHGVDTDIYKRLSKEERLKRRHELGLSDEKIVFLMVARNQFRKNIPEFCKGWKKFKEAGNENAVFWPHMAFSDPMGWDLREIFKIYGIEKDLVYFKEIAESSTNIDMIDEGRLAILYNAADVTVMLSGEGFGLPTLESMACGTLVLALEHSANIEIVQGRGELVPVQSYVTGGHSTERPLPDIDALVEKLILLSSNPKLREEYGELSYQYAKDITWKSAVSEWDNLLTRLEWPYSQEEVLAERVC